MKIAYLGKVQLSDADLSYLHSAQKHYDMTYLLEVNPRFMKGPAMNIKKVYPHTGIFKALEAYPEFAKYAGLIDMDKFYVVNTCGKLWQFKAFWTNLLLLLFLIKHRFEVIHLTWPANVYEFIIYLLRKRMVLTVHDPFPHTGLGTSIVRLRRKVAFSLIPKFIILNEAQRPQFLEFYHLQQHQVYNSRLSCYTYLHSVSPNHSLVPQAPYILFVGKISQYKGVDYLLPAMKKAHEAFPDIRLVVAGSGRYHFDISPYRQLDYVDIRNRFIPDEELVALIQGARFMVCPYTDATQSGVVMSAFAFGTPVVATRVGGLPEMLLQGQLGMLIEERNTEAIAEAIKQLLAEPERVDAYRQAIDLTYGANGRLSWDEVVRDMKPVYWSIADEPHRHNGSATKPNEDTPS